MRYTADESSPTLVQLFNGLWFTLVWNIILLLGFVRFFLFNYIMIPDYISPPMMSIRDRHKFVETFLLVTRNVFTYSVLIPSKYCLNSSVYFFVYCIHFGNWLFWNAAYSKNSLIYFYCLAWFTTNNVGCTLSVNYTAFFSHWKFFYLWCQFCTDFAWYIPSFAVQGFVISLFWQWFSRVWIRIVAPGALFGR